MASKKFRDVVIQEKNNNRCDSKGFAYDPKKREFEKYWEHVTEKPLVDVPSNHPNRYELTPDNYFNFLFYQSRRDKYKKGLKNVVGETKFDAKGYDRDMNHLAWISDISFWYSSRYLI